jgi:hypothetical protein
MAGARVSRVTSFIKTFTKAHACASERSETIFFHVGRSEASIMRLVLSKKILRSSG